LTGDCAQDYACGRRLGDVHSTARIRAYEVSASNNKHTRGAFLRRRKGGLP